MGRFLSKHDIVSHDRQYEIPWYFETAWWDSSNSCYRFSLPNTDFPIPITIHYDSFDGVRALRPTIRKFVERELSGDVIWEVLDYSYFFHTGPYTGDGYSVSHFYAAFYLENDADAVLFKLRFGDYITGITPRKDHHR